MAGGGAAALAALLPAAAAAQMTADGAGSGRRRGGKVADLTHVFRAGFPVYAGDEPERVVLKTFAADGFYSQGWTFGEHSGTHMDAPGHFVEGRAAGPAAAPGGVLRPDRGDRHLRARGRRTPDAALGPADIARYERRHGRIPRGAAVLMHSGWDAKAGDDAAFKNVGADGMYHFPGFGADAVELLIKRKAGVIGVDTMSLDPGNSTTFAAHVAWLGADRYGLENVANLGTIPRARRDADRRRDPVGGGLRRTLPAARPLLTAAGSSAG